MRKWLFGAGMGTGLLLAGAAILLLRPGFEDAGCACVSPPTLEQIQADIHEVEKDSGLSAVAAAGRVWQGYVLRGDKAEAERWRNRAIELRDPETTGHLASERIMSVNEAKSDEEKRRRLRDVLTLLERGYPNRASLDALSGGIYAHNMRSARAALAVMETGPDPWIRKAEAGDATAAHHLARYYFYVLLDQDQRSRWEQRGAELGDPELAHDAACCWRQTPDELREGKRIIAAARNNRQAWADIDDPWMIGIIAADLDQAETLLDRRLAAAKLR